MPSRVSTGAAGALTTPPVPQVEFELTQLPDGDANVKILIDQIILVAQNNNDKSELLSKIVEQMLKDFKKNIDTLEQSKTEADQAATAAASATEALRMEKDGLDADKQVEITRLSAELNENLGIIRLGKQEAAQKTHEYNTELSLLQGQCDELTGICEGKDKNLHAEAEKITQLQQALSSMSEVGKEKEGEITAIRAALDKAISNHKRELDDLRELLNTANVDSGTQQLELDVARQSARDLTSRLEGLNKENNNTRHQNDITKAKNEELLNQIAGVNAKVGELARSAAAANDAAAGAKQEVVEEKAKCTQMAAEINKLNEALATMKDSGEKLGNIGNIIDPNADASKETADLLARMKKLNDQIADSIANRNVVGGKKTRKKKNKKKRNSTKRIVFKTKKLNKKTRIKKVKKVNRRPVKKLTRKRK
jgi:chromosome segregation ATPase